MSAADGDRHLRQAGSHQTSSEVLNHSAMYEVDSGRSVKLKSSQVYFRSVKVISVSASFLINSYFVDQLGSKPRVVGRIGSAAWVSASFQM